MAGNGVQGKNTPAQSSLKVAAVYIGTVVGAGFASGQEVLQFFGYFGLWGLAGLAVATVLLAYFGYAAMILGHRLDSSSYRPLIRMAGGRWAGNVVDAVITFFLFGALTIMAAGAGALFAEQFGLPSWTGSTLMVAVSLATVLLGFGGVISAISFFVPFLLAAVVGVSLYTLITNWPALVANAGWSVPARAAVGIWPLAALNYVSYNMVLAVAVLAPLGAVAAPPAIRRGALWGGLGLGLGAIAIFLSTLARVPQAAAFEVPMVFSARSIGPWVGTVYGLVLLAEIYTTAVGSLYGFVSRLADPQGPRFRLVAVAASLAGLAAAQVGFSRMVGIVFPVVGYAGFLLLGSLAYAHLRDVIRPLAGDLLRLAGVRPAYRRRVEPGKVTWPEKPSDGPVLSGERAEIMPEETGDTTTVFRPGTRR